jgi:tellurite resistance protein TehA-like permease
MPDTHPVPARLATLSPANFAIVMATGVIGVAAHQQEHDALAVAMLALAAVAWLVLVGLSVARWMKHRASVLADLRSHQRAPGFFTTVAGTSVLGALWLILESESGAAMALAGLAFVLWLVLNYGILLALTVQREKPQLADGISGGWLLIVVATQSIAVLAALIAPAIEQPTRLAFNFGALVFWLCGGMLYVWVISLIFYRYTFLRFAAQDLTPTYWINMGAMAISALAGAQLVLAAPAAPLLEQLWPFLKGATLLFWAVGTWWIPMMLALAAWRYLHQRHPLRYDVSYWGAVFPLGMYSAATHQVALALHLRFLLPVARGFFFIAIAAWVVTAVGLARHVRRAVGRAPVSVS